jgi:hypothetical protein
LSGFGMDGGEAVMTMLLLISQLALPSTETYILSLSAKILWYKNSR